MEILFIAAFTLVWILISWLLSYLSGDDKSKLFRWVRGVYLVIIPVSIITFLYETIISKEGINFDGLSTGMLFINLFVVSLIFITWLIYNHYQKKRNSSYYKRRDGFTERYMEQHIYMFFMLVLVVMPILNIYSIIEFIKEYLIK